MNRGTFQSPGMDQGCYIDNYCSRMIFDMLFSLNLAYSLCCVLKCNQ